MVPPRVGGGHGVAGAAGMVGLAAPPIVLQAVQDEDWVRVDSSSNHFNYRENINAVYGNAASRMKDLVPTDPSKPAKLYFNATGSNLAEKFKEIADELSNLRIVG